MGRSCGSTGPPPRTSVRGALEPDPDLAKALVRQAAAKGVVLLSCGIYGNVIRFLVPLTASDAIVREGLGIVAEALRELTGVAVRAAANG